MALLPRRIGRFDVLSELGRGGMGVVYKVRDPNSMQIAALKMVPHEALEKQDSRLRFMREFRAMQRVEHPNICRVFETGTHDDCPFFTMEFIEGKEIRRWLDGDEPLLPHTRDRPPEPPFSTAQLATLNHPDRVRRIINVITQVAFSLGEIHAHRIVHRDLKPDNILVTPAGLVKLMDFGIAKQLSAGVEQSSGGMLLGTFKYLAPEQALGGALDGRADLYCLGVILFEMIAGRHPYHSDTSVGYAFLHARKEAPPILQFNPTCNPKLAVVIDRMLRKLPNERYATADDVIAALREATSPVDVVDKQNVGGGASAGVPFELKRDQVFQPALVGRQGELDKLMQAAQGLNQGRGSIIAIHGLAGSGKSRLARDAATLLKTKNVDVATGRCVTGGAPYHPFVDVLEHMLREIEHMAPDAQRRMLGDEGHVLARYASFDAIANSARPRPAAGLEPQSERLRFLGAVMTFLQRMSGLRPRMLVIDDVQRADEMSLGLIRHLADTMARPEVEQSLQRGTTLALVTLYNGEDAGADGVRGLLSKLARVTTLQLKPLSPAEVTDMLRSMLGAGEVSPALGEYLAAEHGGWPGPLEDRIRSWVEAGTLARRGRQWVMVRPLEEASSKPPAAIELGRATRFDVELAASKVDLHAERISRLAGTTRALAERTALYGDRITATMLMRLALRPEEEVLDAIDELIKRGIWEEDKQQADFVFLDAGDRTALLAGISNDKKQQLHIAIANALIEDARRVRKAPLAEELARHYLAAGATLEAVQQLMVAARRALGVSATQTAAGHVRAAQELVGVYQRAPGLESSTSTIIPAGNPDLARTDAELVLLRLDVLAAVNEHKECVSLARRRLPRLERGVDGSVLAEVLLRLANSERALGDLDAALDHTATVLQRTERGDGHRLRCRAKSLAGSIYEQRGEFDVAARYFSDALALAQTIGDVAEEERARASLAHRLLATGELDAAARSFQQLLDLAQSRGETLSVTNYVNALGWVAHEQARYDDAEVCYRRIVELAKPAGDRRSLALALCNISIVRSDQERHHDASLLAQKAMRMLKELDQAELLSYIHIVESQLALDRGDDAKVALQAADAALLVAGRAHAVREEVEASLCRGLALSRLDDDTGLSVISASLARAQSLQLKRLQFFGQECWIEATSRQGDAKSAALAWRTTQDEASRVGFLRASSRLHRLRRRLRLPA
jgi:predicted ATPase/tRNA A-37 threonylcarbamoyl transferase component Bud32